MKRNLLACTVLICIAAALAGCKDKPKPEPNPNPKPDPTLDTAINTANKWIYKYMEEWYLWREDITTSPNHELSYSNFFNSLLSTNRADGKNRTGTHHFYSYIEREVVSRSRAVTPPPTFGFDFMLTAPFMFERTPGNVATAYQPVFAQVTFVYAGSTAETAGLKRGDYIYSINGTEMTLNNYGSLYPYLLSGRAGTLALKWFRGITDTGRNTGNQFSTPNIPISKPVNDMPANFASANTFENPVQTVKVITTDAGKKVGYMHYTTFQTGYPEFQDFSFDNSMKQAMASFASAGVQTVVIDMRYNGGGAVSSCMLMSSMLIPSGKLGTHFGRFQRNSFVSNKYFNGASGWSNFYTLAQMAQPPYDASTPTNLNLSKVYVIGTEATASASEMVINALRGVDVQVFLIGTQTEGKNVGMDLVNTDMRVAGYSNPAQRNKPIPHDGIYQSGGVYYKYSMRPITFYIYNAKEQADYAQGFTPNYEIDEFDYANWAPLGDKNEVMLAAALKHIDSGAFPANSRSGAQMTLLRPALKQPQPAKRGGLVLYHGNGQISNP